MKTMTRKVGNNEQQHRPHQKQPMWSCHEKIWMNDGPHEIVVVVVVVVVVVIMMVIIVGRSVG